MVFKIHLLLLFVTCADTTEQVIWSEIKELNDVYTNLRVMHQREKTGCIECGTRAKMMNGESFSCHNADQKCLVHDTCHLKFNLQHETLITAVGWRHFCNKIYNITTDGSWIDIGPLLLGRFSIQFAVKASNDAYFGLSSGDTTALPGYWIVLEGFSMAKNCLRDGFTAGSTCFATHIAPYLTNTEYVRYWVQWDHGNVRVGIGKAFRSAQIMQHQFPAAYYISNVLLKSFKNKADWIIYL
ncbi:uncharacterized protein LOC128157685 [Crassostrea angulata]|uniref:uncharacterized protein LOC128157685 n=1 Tax=Magallana angulata TaxID=2784310 RepID=UPI0022B1B133|nr:uncharacterized protein LOC128157685 [Crassostrea angulata]